MVVMAGLAGLIETSIFVCGIRVDASIGAFSLGAKAKRTGDTVEKPSWAFQAAGDSLPSHRERGIDSEVIATR
jgi:hypothetical protein